MATINPSQDYDIIHTLTYPSASGSGRIRLHRGSDIPGSGTVYYRAGTSGSWTSLSVSGLYTTFPISNTTMQIAHNWNIYSNNYMTASFKGDGSVKEIKISQKAVLSGVVGNAFMYGYASDCTSLTSLDIPDTSSITSVGSYFMYSYASYCYSLTSLDVPDTSSVTSVGGYFMDRYAFYSSSLTSLRLPKAGWFYSHNIDWMVPSGRLGYLKGVVKDPDDLADWKYLASASGRTLYTNYIQDPDNVILLQTPPTITTTSVSHITNRNAQLNLELTSDGGGITTIGTCHSTAPNPVSTDNPYTKIAGVGTYQLDIPNLLANTKYYVRSFATNSAGTSYGAELDFTTDSEAKILLQENGRALLQNSKTIKI